MIYTKPRNRETIVIHRAPPKKEDFFSAVATLALQLLCVRRSSPEMYRRGVPVAVIGDAAVYPRLLDSPCTPARARTQR